MTPVLLIADPDTDRDAWLAARRQGIGASEIAAVLGISPWDSPFSLYWRKKLDDQVEMNEAMEWGLRHETTIAAKFAENHPDLFLTEGGLYRNAEHNWMLATPDRMALRRSDRAPAGLVQIKTAHSWDGWGTPGTDQVPVHYRAQVQQEMAVMGAPRCWIPVLVGGNSYREYVVDADPEDVALIVKAGAEFMRRLADDEPPDLDGAAATTATLKQLHPTVVDEVVTIPTQLADAYRTRKELLDDAQAAFDETCNRIRGLLGDARTAVADGRKVAQRSVYEQARLDTKRLKAEEPDLYAAYAQTSLVSKLLPCKETTR